MAGLDRVVGNLADYMKAEGHLGRRYVKVCAGYATNPIPSAVCYNLRSIFAWLEGFITPDPQRPSKRDRRPSRA